MGELGDLALLGFRRVAFIRTHVARGSAGPTAAEVIEQARRQNSVRGFFVDPADDVSGSGSEAYARAVHCAVIVEREAGGDFRGTRGRDVSLRSSKSRNKEKERRKRIKALRRQTKRKQRERKRNEGTEEGSKA